MNVTSESVWPHNWRPAESWDEADYLAALLCDSLGQERLLPGTQVEMRLAASLGQLAISPQGEFVAWLRAPLAHEPALRGEEREAALLDLLQAGQAQDGPLLLVTDLYAPAKGLRATKWLTRLPGVQRVCGETGGRWRSVLCRG